VADDEVKRMGADAQAVLDALAAEPPSDNAAIQGALSRVFDRANALIRDASDPIAIGIVGEFSVGKSMLLGTLLGQPTLLPVEERATTGNITALYILPGEPNQRTGIDGAATVHFLTENDLEKCVEYMVGELVSAAAYSKLADVASLQGGYNPVTGGWEKLETWCRRQLWIEGVDTGSLTSRKIAAELLSVRDAHLSVAKIPGFLGGQAVAGSTVVKAALDLQPSESNPDVFPARSPRFGLDLTTVGHDESALAKVFPLIRRVSYRVRVDPEVWELESLRGDSGNSIVILDFPGLEANRSATRDEYLSKHELEQVHTIITVYNSAHADSGVPHRFFGMLESHDRTAAEVRNYIIAVGNAFDRIPTPSRVLASVPLTVEALCQASTDFRSLRVSTSDLTQKREDRVRVVSSIAATLKYGYSTEGFSDDQKARIAEAAKGIAERQAQWQRIGERLTLGEPDSPWGPTLAAFGADGGIKSLRHLIKSHIAEHGLVNKINALRLKRAQLVQALGQLEVLLPAERSTGDDAAKAQLRVEQVSDVFRRQTPLTIEAADLFRDPMQLKLSDTGVIEAARLRCMAMVMAWPEWSHLVLRAKGGLITKAESASSDPDDDDDDDPLGRYRNLDGGSIDDTHIFFDRFRQSSDDILQSARAELTVAVAEWISERNSDLSGLQDELLDPALLELLDRGGRRLAAMERGDADRILPLRTLADLSWANRTLAGVIRRGVVTDEHIADTFPLPRPRYLPWHRGVPERLGDVEQSLARHQMYLFRMRREIASAMADAVAARLAQDIVEFRRRLLRTLNTGMAQIPTPETVHLMFHDPSTTADDLAKATDVPGSPVRSLLRQWRARGA
jgi:hypothetical protein